MRALSLPGMAASHVFGLCVTGTSDVALQARLAAIAPVIGSTALNYEALALSERLDLVPRVTSVGAVTRDELVALYGDHLSAAKGCARGVYDQLRNAAPHKKCPLCGVGTVGALDHHLPQSRYPDLAVVPANLVPACQYCNGSKRARYPLNQGQQTLHPYFDARLINSRWMHAVVNQGPPVSVLYEPRPPAHWSLVDQQRVKRHFDVCGLSVLFSSNANDELSVIKSRLVAIEQGGGSAAIHSYLIGEVAHLGMHTNSWQLSMYDALASDLWFIGGGFHLIA